MRESEKNRRLSVSLMVLVGGACAVFAASYPKIEAIGQLYGGPPPHTFVPPLTIPTDATNPVPTNANFNAPGMDTGLSGIVELKSFPSPEDLKGSPDFIVVKYAPGTDWRKDTSYLATLTSGQLLVGVKRPSRMGMVHVPVGVIALTSSSDALIAFQNGVLRITNMDAMGTNLKVNLNKGPFAGAADPIYAIKPGFELVAGDHKLSREEVHPNDGVMRRKPTVIGNGYIAISQIQEDSILRNNVVVAGMNQKDADPKSKRIISDMSRMAAVLNQVNGYSGFSK